MCGVDVKCKKVKVAMIEYDKGPTKKIARLFAQHPDYSLIKDHFWFDWGPVFYRGRLNGSARLLCVASDPGPTERIVGRALVGDAGQKKDRRRPGRSCGKCLTINLIREI